MTMQQLYEELIACGDQLDAANALYTKGINLLNVYAAHSDKEMLPVSVEYYLEEVERSGLISMEGSLIEVKSPIMDTLKRILQGIYDAIKWIIVQFIDIFRLIFDMYYRAQRKFNKQQQFLLQFIDPTMRDKFENTMMKTVRFDDFQSFNKQLKNLILTLQSGSRVASFEHVARLFVNCDTTLGCRIDASSTIVNIVDTSKLETTGVLKAIGWTYQSVSDTLAEMIITAHDTVTLQRLNKDVERNASDLKSQVEKNVRENAHPANVTHLQEKLNMQRQIHAFVKSGLIIVATRMTWMDKYFSEFIDLMRNIQSGKVK